MDIKYFKLIKTIQEEGNLANSSDKLFLTQSALSHQLKELEERLGFKVFYRTRNKWTLTDEGVALYKLGNRILDTIEKGFQDIAQIQEGSKGNIKISTECYSFYQGLSGFIQKMKLLYPEITVDFDLEATHQPISKVVSREIDIAIVTAKPKDNSLVSTAFFEDEIFAVMHKENQFAELPYLEPDSFVEMHLIIHSYPLETVAVYEHFLKPRHVMPYKISAIPLTEVSLEMVAANMGVMCMPRWGANSFVLPDDLIFKKILKQGLKRKHYLVVRKEDRSKRYIQDFIANFKECFLR